MFEDIIKSARDGMDEKKDEVKNEVDSSSTIRIAVIGVGGAGCNCVNRMKRNGLKSAHTIAINTDARQLNIIDADKKILIGKTITKGLGAGGSPEVARKCADADASLIAREIGENQLVFVVAGMGGGTGTGAAPVIARLAKDQGAIVVAIVTYPFALERVRLKVAQKGIEELKKEVDTLIIIDNNRLASYAPNLPIDKAFALADSITGRAVRGITDTISFPSLLNVDFADVKSVMENGGIAFISLGEGSGPDKVNKVIQSTLDHPLLDVSYEGAKGALIHIEGGPSLTLGDAIKVGEGISEQFDENANVKLGARISPELRDKIRATAIIVGVHSPMMFSKEEDKGDPFNDLF